MDVKEKLVEILKQAPFEGKVLDEWWWEEKIKRIADHLISNGVTVQEWVSVDDMFPDKDGCYIVAACDEGCSCGDGIWYDTVVIEAEYYKGEWSWNENGTEYDITDLVTH